MRTVTQNGLCVYASEVLILPAVYAVVIPRVAYVQHNLVEHIQIFGVAEGVGKTLCRNPAAATQIVEQGVVHIVVEVVVGEIVVVRAVISCGAPRGLQ